MKIIFFDENKRKTIKTRENCEKAWKQNQYSKKKEVEK